MTTSRDFDWPYIRLCYEKGEGASSISRRLGRPTKQAIAQRAKREGWDHPQVSRETPALLPAIARALSVSSTKLSDEVIETVIGMIGTGAPKHLAVQAAGISPNTWARWEKQDQRLADLVQRARAGKLSEWIGRIDHASTTDWKAADRLLQTAPETKEQFGSTGGAGAKLEVVINISRDGEHKGVTIEGQTETE